MTGNTLYTLEVCIIGGADDRGIRQGQSRGVIRGDQTLQHLHRMVFGAFDRWDDCHLHEFHLGREPRDRHAIRYLPPDDPDDLDAEPAARSVQDHDMSLQEA